MDGIDGLAGSEAAAIGAGLLLFASIGAGADPALRTLAAVVTGAAIGFLVWNWSPAWIFFGDVGSVPLGYVLGFLLLDLAVRGFWKIALILPLYFLADATITLARRLLRGERVWEAHREHFYQQAVRRGLGHAAVVERVIAADLVLIGCGWGSENGWGSISLALSAAMTASPLPIRRALISVNDKTGIVAFARALAARGVVIISTGGSAQTLAADGIPVTEVAQITGVAEFLDGRVKTLHPAIHAGLLVRRDRPDHLAALAERRIAPIELLVCNLYPFAQTVASGANHEECVENIDIGGVALIRAAAKNHDAVTVLTDPADYD